MEGVLICLILLFLMVISGVITRFVSFLPTPLIQIAIGTLLADLFPAFFDVGFNPELFMLLFVPPLLFNDSWHFPKREFLLYTRPIIMLSIGLVFFTVAGIGYLVHWLIPLIPLPAAFALAAVLSPTDAVSLKSMTAGARIPDRMMHILQGEALLNDASGLVSFKLAVAAMVTGVFSVKNALLSLLIISFGGIAVGVSLTFVFISLLGKLAKHNVHETTTENLLLLLLPFTVYLVAEKAGFSGILAAVSAGFAVDRAGFLDRTLAKMRLEGHFVWGVLDITLNGIIFILLGLYLPHSIKFLKATGYSLSEYAMIVILITMTLFFLRTLWIYLTLPFEALISRRNKSTWRFPNLKIISTFSLGGVRGAIALAAILSLPHMIHGAPFPERKLLIILVIGVVLCSLLISSLLLPLITPGLKNLLHKPTPDEESEAVLALSKAAVEAIKDKMKSLCEEANERERVLCTEVANKLIDSFNQFIISNHGTEIEKMESMLALTFEQQLRYAALEGAHKELRTLRKERKINNTTMMKIISRLDLRQIALHTEHQTISSSLEKKAQGVKNIFSTQAD
ncbi:Na+/H+ antiporter [Fluoribacter dumoffii]|uniref:Na+/H+ antiporter n=1 Tax=Fluoribacter dumoffii TaxID=463 RepID=UPI00026C76AD|nr:Na+/H+ antiporter [Fluoribacter dumoffii]MCW8417537.1 Na+/H+ antiporter [Fluoribacter dumoffii]MCW8454621.1 Na+/H+ antiporter [Fluoribacter dumoffii]MCW8461302.1 Na+/H+ antiporter [Fluoribacter dumoffii]MCW8484742.1 Na+/H+ antiporter [Fluoribacter dumoffii]